MTTRTTYGLGGFDPNKPDANATEVVEVAVPPEIAARGTIEDRLRSDLAAMQAVVDTPAINVTGTTVAEVRSSVQQSLRDLQRQVKDLARTNKRLIRLGLAAFDATD